MSRVDRIDCKLFVMKLYKMLNIQIFHLIWQSAKRRRPCANQAAPAIRRQIPTSEIPLDCLLCH